MSMPLRHRVKRFLKGPEALGWRIRTFWHDYRDINCIHWDSRARHQGECGPCRKTGGYAARRHAQIDQERALRHG